VVSTVDANVTVPVVDSPDVLSVMLNAENEDPTHSYPVIVADAVLPLLI
jgi:hypothetical protein